MNRRDVIGGIWLIGLGILFLFDFFWPGVLILAGLSMIVTALMPPVKREMPPVAPPAKVVDVQAKEEPQPAPAQGEPLPPSLAEKADLLYRQSLLPETCPSCGAPVKQNADKVTWQNDETAACPFCSARISVTRPAA